MIRHMRRVIVSLEYAIAPTHIYELALAVALTDTVPISAVGASHGTLAFVTPRVAISSAANCFHSVIDSMPLDGRTPAVHAQPRFLRAVSAYSITDAVTFDGVINAVKQASAHENGGNLDVIN